MNKLFALLIYALLLISLSSCAKPPEQCHEEISVNPELGGQALERIYQMANEGMLRLDLGTLTPAEQAKVGLLLTAQELGAKGSTQQVNLSYVEAQANKIKALSTDDKAFFFTYRSSFKKPFYLGQIEIEWRIGQLKSNTTVFRITKTGYFDSKGNLLCFWTRTPKTAQ